MTDDKHSGVHDQEAAERRIASQGRNSTLKSPPHTMVILAAKKMAQVGARSREDDHQGRGCRGGPPAIEQTSIPVKPDEVERHSTNNVPDVVDNGCVWHPLILKATASPQDNVHPRRLLSKEWIQ